MFGNNLRTRVLLALIFLSIVPALAISYQGYHCGRMAVTALTRLHVESVAESRVDMISEWLDERVRGITTLVHLPVVVRELEGITSTTAAGPNEELKGVIDAVSAFSDQYESMTILDRGWRVLAASSHGHHDKSEFSDADFKAAVELADGVYIAKAHRHEKDEVGSHLGISIKNASGDIVGYLVSNINLTSSLTPILQHRSGLWNTGKSYILDADGQFVTQPYKKGSRVDFDREIGGHGPNQPALEQGRMRIYRDFRGIKVIGTSLPLSVNDWRLVVEIDLAEAMAWARILVIRAAIMVAVSLLAVLAISIWLSGIVGAPLARLATMAHRIAEGHTEERMEPMKLREADDVGQAVNRMLDELRDKERVIVRTATLAIVGELTSRIVHEMRNPLSSIKMNIQSLMGDESQDEQNRELAEIAFGQVARLESMLNELLQYGRPLALEFEKTSAVRLVTTVAASVASTAAERGVVIDLKSSVTDDSILVDIEQIRRAVVNLLANAIEASPRGARVSVNIERAPRIDAGVRIVVSDEGNGIHDGNMEKLFKPFFTTKGNGIGLGLANVEKIVGMHGGVVGFENRPTGGARFSIDLPGAAAGDSRSATGTETDHSGGKDLTVSHG